MVNEFVVLGIDFTGTFICDFEVIIWFDLEDYSIQQGSDITEQYLSRGVVKSDYLSAVSRTCRIL